MAAKVSNFQLMASFLDAIRDLDQHDVNDYITPLLPHISLVSASEAAPSSNSDSPLRVVFAYTVQPQHCNRMGNLHGGAVATLFDFCTSIALAVAPRFQDSMADTFQPQNHNGRYSTSLWSRLGVSRTLAVTYLRPAPRGLELQVECELVHVGRRLCHLRGTLRRRSDSAILASCQHDKALIETTAAKL